MLTALLLTYLVLLAAFLPRLALLPAAADSLAPVRELDRLARRWLGEAHKLVGLNEINVFNANDLRLAARRWQCRVVARPIRETSQIEHGGAAIAVQPDAAAEGLEARVEAGIVARPSARAERLGDRGLAAQQRGAAFFDAVEQRGHAPLGLEVGRIACRRDQRAAHHRQRLRRRLALGAPLDGEAIARCRRAARDAATRCCRQSAPARGRARAPGRDSARAAPPGAGRPGGLCWPRKLTNEDPGCRNGATTAIVWISTLR